METFVRRCAGMTKRVPPQLAQGFVQVDHGSDLDDYAVYREWDGIRTALDLSLEFAMYTDVYGAEHKRRTEEILGVTRVSAAAAQAMADAGYFDTDGVLE